MLQQLTQQHMITFIDEEEASNTFNTSMGQDAIIAHAWGEVINNCDYLSNVGLQDIKDNTRMFNKQQGYKVALYRTHGMINLLNLTLPEALDKFEEELDCYE